MAKSENVTPRLFTVKKARIYLEQAGVKVGDQQVRNLMRTDARILEGLTEYTNPITDEVVKVVTGEALDSYVAWRAANPENVQRGGRKSDGLKRVNARMTDAQIAATNVWLNSQSFPELVAPVRKARDPNAPRKTRKGNTTTPDNGVHEVAEQDLSELELIEV